MSLSQAQIKPYKRLTLAKPTPSIGDAAKAPYEALKCEIEAPSETHLQPLTKYGTGLADLAQRLPGKQYSLRDLTLELGKNLRISHQRALSGAHKLINQRAVLEIAPNVYTLNTMY
jgi:hypothetical protein